MLCPKCGYITFDKLDTCPKCRKKCAVVGDSRVGLTSAGIEAPCFLGSVIKSSVPDNAGLKESLASSEGPELDLGEEEVILDELPGIDFSDSGTGDDHAEDEGIDFVFSMDGESDDVVIVEGDAGPASLDLNDIDLSDLVTEETATEKAPRGKGGEIDLGMQSQDSKQEEVELDLSALEGLEEQSDSDVIDLDLDEALDLSLDLELDADSQKDKKDSPVIPDLGLSLDLDE